MMGKQPRPQNSLFYVGIDIDNRVRKNHPLRKVDELIDFDFAYAKVKDCYGNNGNVSIPPPIILKLMLLLIFYNVRSERELMDTLPERMDWLWFLGYDLDTVIPDHSVLSKARKRWGLEVFQEFFERIVVQCVEAGLVDGSKIFVDSSLVEADASNNSIIDTRNLKHQLHKNYKKLESRLEEISKDNEPSQSYAKTNDRFMSTTDPEAAIVNRGKGGKAKLTYQVHRAVDGQREIITATDAAPGDVNEAHLMLPLFEKHCTLTGTKAETIVADSKYGTIENFLACHDQGIAAHIPDLGAAQRKKAVTKEIFSEEHFLYDPATDTYRCPAGNLLKPKSLHNKRQSMDYAAPRIGCAACRLREQCTKNKSGRTVKRHLRQDVIDIMREASHSAKSQRDIKTRQHLMERSFARATRYGFDRARWRGLWKMRIQEYLTCAIQNIQVLVVEKSARPKESIALRASVAKSMVINALYHLVFFSNLLFLTSSAHAESSFQRT